MPEDLGSVMGSNFDTSAQSGKKKLKKVGDHWEDEAGVKYADAEGNIALKEDEIPRQKLKDLPNEQAQAAGGAPAQSVMDPWGERTGTGGWAVGEGTPAQQKSPDWQVTPTDKTRSQGNETSQPSGTSDEEYFNKYFELAYPNGVSDKDMKKLRQMWSGLSQEQKDQWMEQAQQRKKKAKSSVMG